MPSGRRRAPDGDHQSTLSYNAAGQPLTIATPAGTTQLGYDQWILPPSPTPGATRATRCINGAGVCSLTDRRGPRRRYDYDVLNELTTITDPLAVVDAVPLTQASSISA